MVDKFMTESNNTAHANISVTQNSTNGLVEFNITAYDVLATNLTYHRVLHLQTS